MTSKIFKKVSSSHDDIIHDLVYDFYGKRIASCSSDQKISVWDIDENQEWTRSYSWKAHNALVCKLDWALPEFGQVIASCSHDRKVIIWEEIEKSSDQKNWKSRAELTDSQESIVYIKFAPSHLGLKLATGGNEGIMRIYEALDITNLSQWQISEQFNPSETKSQITCFSWNNSPFNPPLLAIGLNENTPKIWQYNNTNRKWQAVCSLVGHSDHIQDIAWAPNIGRNYDLIATASRDQTVKIWKVESIGDFDYEAKVIASFGDHEATVWRVEWNITGTILASSGDDNKVRLWKSNFKNEWACLNVISEDKCE